MGHCACVVETGLASIGWVNQKIAIVLSIASMQSRQGLGGINPQEIFKITCSEIECESILRIHIAVGIIHALAVHILYSYQHCYQVTFTDTKDPVTHYAQTQNDPKLTRTASECKPYSHTIQ